MSGFTTGLNSLRTAAQLIQMGGDNIANANTPGYHVKRATVAPVIGPTIAGVRIGLGSTVEDVRRVRNELIEKALLEHVQARELFGAELDTLTHLEQLFAEPTEASLDARLGEFFDAIDLLAADPDDATLREQVVQKAQAVCDIFHRLNDDLNQVIQDLENNIDYEVNRVNALTERIAALNQRIRSIETSGATAGSLKDSRDQLISELAEIINLKVYQADFGVVNVSCSGTLLVHEGNHSTIAAERGEEGLVLRCEEAAGHELEVREGRLAGLLQMRNDTVPTYSDRLDDLADALRRAVNLVHTVGLGLDGRFEALNGLNAFNTTEPFADLGYDVVSGTAEKLVVNVENQATGQVTQFELTLDTTQAADAFLISVRDAINATVTNVNATIDDGKLNLAADNGYAFGFATPYDPNPAEAGDITAAGPTVPSLLDDYTGGQDLVYQFTFMQTGQVGTDSIDIQIDVRDTGGALLRTLTRSVDDTYMPGDTVEVENGLRLALTEGNVSAGDGFSTTAYADTDTAGVLDALGLNVMLTGLGAAEIEVADRLVRDPSLLAGSLRPMAGDNHRFLDLSALRDAHVASDGAESLNGAYRSLVSHIGTARNTRSVQHENQEDLVTELTNQRDSVSGVSVDEEMIKMMTARTIYQGTLKYVSMLDGILSELVSLA
ncbi:MAG: flagellar hook-associated protein FlgK [Candidatus Brocadiia bacterium]